MKHVRVEPGRVARIVLTRPPLNILHLDMLAELATAFTEARDADPAVVVLAAEGRAFSAGVDVADHTPERVAEMLRRFHRSFLIMEELEAPLIGLVQGAALGGGCELVAACDLVLAARSATFGQPEIKLGAFAPVAATLLPGVVGPRRAAEMLFTGEPLSAEAARQAGLVNRVVDDEVFGARSDALIDEVGRHSRPVLQVTKAALRRARGRPLADALTRLESLYLEDLMSTEDAREGLSAFLEKRPARFRDR